MRAKVQRLCHVVGNVVLLANDTMLAVEASELMDWYSKINLKEMWMKP
jgi:hypothetical protein